MAKAQTKAVTTNDKDFNAPGVQGQKGFDADQEKEIVRGEDVIRMMRDKGHQI